MDNDELKRQTRAILDAMPPQERRAMLEALMNTSCREISMMTNDEAISLGYSGQEIMLAQARAFLSGACVVMNTQNMVEPGKGFDHTLLQTMLSEQWIIVGKASKAYESAVGHVNTIMEFLGIKPKKGKQ